MPFRLAISAPAQLKALTSPLRQELLDLLARAGAVSAAELGRLLRRPADGLYYHLRELKRVGLVSSSGTRVRRGRSEELFRSVHREPMLAHDPSPSGNSREVTAIVASMLRLGTRDFRKACALPGVRTRGPRRNLWALRVTGWLAPDDFARVNRRIRALRDTVRRQRSRGELYAVTILLTPLGQRARKSQRRARRAREIRAS